MPLIERILIANRGEIACRIMRTCREMGIETVAVFSDADAEALHVRTADRAVRVGPAPPTESYLVIDTIIDAAKRSGADAIHPGYGFLAENAAFAQACADADIIWIGPPPEAIESMGSKIAARTLMQESGVPVVPGFHDADASDDDLIEAAKEIGFPVLVKASAGGGGKGMRIVREAADLQGAIASSRRESEKAFGDGTLFVERYIDRPRHVEIQVLGDTHGAVVHLFERECSIQRRHQKIIEETPSVVVTPELRDQMGQAAVAAAKAVGYFGAGTVEFIVDQDGGFYFLEMNTRLQVEHPITELVTGVDLVREQVRVAEGRPLSFGQEDLSMVGAAVECRLYAEDPDNGFLPATGTLAAFRIPDVPGLRVDTGVERGSEASVHYDPLLAKLVTHGEDRAEATRRMVTALRRLSVHGVTTNRAFLLRVLTHPAYLRGEIDTHFIDRELSGEEDGGGDDAVPRAAIAATLARQAARVLGPRPVPTIPSGFRSNPPTEPRLWHVDEWAFADEMITVRYRTRDDVTFDVRVEYDGESEPRFSGTVERRDAGEDTLVLEIDRVRDRFRVAESADKTWVEGLDRNVELAHVPRFGVGAAAEDEGSCLAPMPGKVLQVLVSAGDEVAQGAVLVILEAMKMEHSVRAPADGVVERVAVDEGEQVDGDQVLVVFAE